MVNVKQYPPRPYDKNEILRYMGVSKENTDSTINDLMVECINICEKEAAISNKICFTEVDLTIKENQILLGNISFENEKYAKKLAECEKAIIFAATVGIGIDRLIEKYSIISPAKALAFQAIGSERIESLCDRFCDELKNDTLINPLPRFSPGYSKIPLEIQKDIFRILNCERNIGLTLCDSMLMSPSKSVTAIVGIEKKGK